MSPRPDPLEQLINKHLDGEISQREQAKLDARLQSDSEARLLLTELKALHQRCTKTVQTLGTTQRPASDIIGQAFARTTTPQAQSAPLIKRLLGGQFAAGIAAGLLFATLMMSLIDRPTAPQNIAKIPVANPRQPSSNPQLVRWPADANVQEMRDGYIYTDDQGKQWLIEGLREDKTVPVIHRQDY